MEMKAQKKTMAGRTDVAKLPGSLGPKMNSSPFSENPRKFAIKLEMNLKMFWPTDVFKTKRAIRYCRKRPEATVYQGIAFLKNRFWYGMSVSELYL